jgi:exodeoxyribonuclease X
MVVRVIDIETTGMDPATDAIIEIASVDLVKGGGVTNARSTYVAPGRPIPPLASAVHHITDEDLRDAPPLAEALPMFTGADVYVAHHCAFEQDFLTRHQTWPLTPWVCTHKCALRVWPDLPGHKNQELRYLLGLAAPYGISRAQILPHRAASDVLITAAILEELMKQVRWGQLVEWSFEPPLHTRLHFGRHRGERYDAVPVDYLAWIAKSDLKDDVKHSAQYWLKQRAGQDEG